MDVDLAPFFLFIMGTATILYACGNSAQILFFGSGDQRPSLLRIGRENEEVVSPSMVVAMVIVSSIGLLLLFYFSSSMVVVLNVLFTFGNIHCLAMALWDWLTLFSNSTVALVLDVIFSVLLVILWVFTKHWVLTNIFTFCTAVTAIAITKVNSFKIAVALAVAFLIDDVWWVFLSPAVFGQSVMIEAARAAGPDLPICFSVVHNGHTSMLGGGDVVLPGLVLDMIMRFDAIHGTSLFVVSFVGYAVGQLVAWTAVSLMQSGQPALLWIFPCVIIPTVVAAYFKGVLRTLWTEGAVAPEEIEPRESVPVQELRTEPVNEEEERQEE